MIVLPLLHIFRWLWCQGWCKKTSSETEWPENWSTPIYCAWLI